MRQKRPPLQGEGRGGDGFRVQMTSNLLPNNPHPPPDLPLEGEEPNHIELKLAPMGEGRDPLIAQVVDWRGVAGSGSAPG